MVGGIEMSSKRDLTIWDESVCWYSPACRKELIELRKNISCFCPTFLSWLTKDLNDLTLI